MVAHIVATMNDKIVLSVKYNIIELVPIFTPKLIT